MRKRTKVLSLGNGRVELEFPNGQRVEGTYKDPDDFLRPYGVTFEQLWNLSPKRFSREEGQHLSIYGMLTFMAAKSRMMAAEGEPPTAEMIAAEFRGLYSLEEVRQSLAFLLNVFVQLGGEMPKFRLSVPGNEAGE